MRKKLSIFVVGSLLWLTACEYTTPPEMLFGNWYIAELKSGAHSVAEEYLNRNNRYLVFNQDGTMSVGIVDTSASSYWMLDSEKNEIIFEQFELMEGVKKWSIKASDNSIWLTNDGAGYSMVLKRIEELPENPVSTKDALFGKWRVAKVTINGYDNTRHYPNDDRWIILAKNGRFYNGDKGDSQNTGFWEVNRSLTKLEFFTEEQKEAFLEFTVANKSIWYEKNQKDPNEPKVRIYFEKEK